MERLIETRHVAAVEYREVTAGGRQQFEDPNRWLFLPQVSGGSVALPSRSDSDGSVQLYWHLHNHTVSTLSLAEVSLTNGQLGKGIQLQIPGQVFSAVAFHKSADSCHIFLLLSNRSVGILRLSYPQQHAQQGLNQQLHQRSSILDALDSRSLRQVDISQHLTSAGVPTAVTTADGYLCISGSEGGVTCLPLPALTSGQQLQQGTVLQLNPSTLISQVRRRMGFAATSSIVAALPVLIPAAGGDRTAGSQHQSLLVVHDDTSCHQWFVPLSRQGLSQTLVSDAASRQLRPNTVLLCNNNLDAAPQSSRRPLWDVLLIWDMVFADSSGQSDIRIMPFKLQIAPAGPTMAKLEPQLQQAQQLAMEWPDASLVDAQVAGQQLLLLCRRAAGGSFIVSYSCRDWSYQGRSQLLQQKVSAEWGMAEELWSCALAAIPAATSAAEQVLGQLLVPGQLCMSSLRQALAYHGSQLTEREVATATLAQLKTRIIAAVELIMSKYPSYSSARCWHMLFASYCELWQQQHALLALYSSKGSGSQGGWLGAIRSGGQLTLLRKPSPAEMLLTDSSPGALDHVLQVVGCQGTSGIPGGAAALAKVRLCLSAVSDILGQPAMRVMTQLVMAGVPVQGELLPKFVELLLQGPSSSASAAVDSTGDLAAGRQQRLSEWRMHRQSRLLFVHEQLAELPHALETLSGVAELTIKTAVAAAGQLQATPAAAAATAALPGSQLCTLLSTVALHATRAACIALQQLLLLLGCLSQLGCVGTTPLTAADQAAIHSDLIPPLTSALRSAAVALWLCKTPASRPIAGAGFSGPVNPMVPGPLLGLKVSTPSATPASTPRGIGEVSAAAAGRLAAPAAAVVPAAAAYWHYPLAAHLLPVFWQQQGGAVDKLGVRVGPLGQQLAVWLMLGGNFDAAAAAVDGGIDALGAPNVSSAYSAVTSSQELAGRAVMIGYHLFVCREYDAMQKLVRLIGGDDPSEAGLQFILGLSIACGIRKGSAAGAVALSPEQRAALLDSAVGHLFRAAAGLCDEAAGPLRLVLLLLRQRQGSSTAAATQGIKRLHIADAAAAAMDMEEEEGVDHQPPEEVAAREAKVRLEFCQAVMLLFEREGITEGAMAFARAALGAVDAAYLPEEQKAKQEQQASLWTSVFNSALDLGLNHDAYTAAISNPQPDMLVDSIRRLLYALVDRGELAQLLALPWAGVVQVERKGMKEPVPFVQLVTDMLERRALHSAVSVQTSAHQVLFDFLVAWGDFKHAAAAMLGCARRLRAAAAGGRVGHLTAEAVVEEIRAAYGASVAMLQLLAPSDAWLDPDQPLLASHSAPAPSVRLNQQQHRSTNGRSALHAVASELPVITLQAVQQESELFSASALLLDQLPGLEIMRYDLAADYVVEQLLGARQFAAAVRLIHALWEKQEQQVGQKLETVAFELAGSCVTLQRGQDADTAGGSLDRELEQSMMSYTGPGYLESAAAAAWHKLRQVLELYDSYDPSSSGTAASGAGPGNSGSSAGSRNVGELGGRLRLAAVDGALSVEAELQLPSWLVQPFRPVNGTAGGMAGSGPDPAALLRVFIKHGRLIDAAEFLKDHLEAWQRQGPLLRVQPCAVWLPLQDMQLLHASLVVNAQRASAGHRVQEAELLGVWSEIVERGLADHLALLRSDGEKLSTAAPASTGAVGMVF